jgi:sugar/nucleoside kinase (ribokinase family)
MSILVIGTVAIDAIETPTQKRPQVLGGSATYIALSAKYFSQDIRLVAVIGCDFPDKYLELLKDNDLDLQGLEIDPEGKTFFWSGRYHEDMNNRDSLDTQLNVLATFQPKVPAAYLDSEILCLGNLSPEVQMQVIEQVPNAKLKVLDTMNFWMTAPFVDGLKEVLKQIDVLIINDAEAKELSGCSNLIKAAQVIRAMGVPTLVIKKGEHGAYLFNEDGIFAAPALPLHEIVDPTGAGDSFMGGFVGYLSQCDQIETNDLKKALLYGTVMASFNVEDFGPEGMLNLDASEIDSRMRTLLALSAVDMELA